MIPCNPAPPARRLRILASLALLGVALGVALASGFEAVAASTGKSGEPPAQRDAGAGAQDHDEDDEDEIPAKPIDRAALEMRLAEIDRNASDVAFSPDGKLLAGTDGTAIRIWSYPAGKLERKLLPSARRGAPRIRFSPDGKVLAGLDDPPGNLLWGESEVGIALWDVAEGQRLGTMTAKSLSIRGAAFAEAGKVLISASADGAIRTWAVSARKEGNPIPDGPPLPEAVAVDPTFAALAAGGGGRDDYAIRMWLLPGVTDGVQLDGHTDRIRDLAFHPSEPTLASASDDGSVRLWNLKQLKETVRMEHADGVPVSLAFHPGGKSLFAAGTDGRITIWDVGKGKRIQSLQADGRALSAVSVHPDGKSFATAGSDGVRLWSYEKASQRPEIWTGLHLDEDEKGVRILAVDVPSPAYWGGLQEGRYILECKGLKIRTVAQFIEIVRDSEIGDSLTILLDGFSEGQSEQEAGLEITSVEERKKYEEDGE